MSTSDELISLKSGPDYPRWSETLRDGSHVLIRPICKQDFAAERDFIETLSPQSRRYRFLGDVAHPSDELIRRFTDIDYEHEVAFAAVVHDDSKDKFVAVSRYSTNVDASSCECAITVMDDWQGKGLGVIMLRHLIDVARSRGIKKMWSMDSAENLAMSELARYLGFERKPDPENASQVIFTLNLSS